MNIVKITLTDGSPVTPDHSDINPETGQQRCYVVLSKDERRRGCVEPFRKTYIHEKCGGATTMGDSIAETFSTDPFFYSSTFCYVCRDHFPIGQNGEFIWDGTNQKVGTIAL
jgi:hypothetical protein